MQGKVKGTLKLGGCDIPFENTVKTRKGEDSASGAETADFSCEVRSLDTVKGDRIPCVMLV